jgi:pimeloyl-ACP methyl ester carboxylesterase/DNA-binding CsgD family transcriptional regulator
VKQTIAVTRMTDGREIAYAVCGSGPPLVYPPGWVSHLELSWAVPPERRFYEALAQGRTLVRYDRPGSGLSSRAEGSQSLQVDLEALDAVIRAIGSPRVDLFGSSMGAHVATVWAAEHPETVERLVLYGGWVRGEDFAPPSLQEHVIGLVRTSWGLGSDVLADILMADEGPAMRAAFVQYQRESTSPEMAATFLEQAYKIDVAPFLPLIKSPTIVLHREHDRASPHSQGQLLAASIPGASFVSLPGRTHVAFLGDAQPLVRAVRRFLGLPPAKTSIGPSLTSRQREVAALVAAGLTNHEIAARLGIDERSAEGHVERIRSRLGFRSRTQLAAWWVASEN